MHTSKLVVTQVSGAAYVVSGEALNPAATGMNIKGSASTPTPPVGAAVKRRHLHVVR